MRNVSNWQSDIHNNKQHNLMGFDRTQHYHVIIITGFLVVGVF